jgi:predicted short-subunit dehydrogenase-like oxidoreductase (DUF2520 family)
MATFRVIGAGRAGRSLAAGLSQAGWTFAGILSREDDPVGAARGVDLLVLATPDAVVAEVAARVAPVPTTVVAHLSGSLGLDVLLPHRRRASIHPLVPLPDPERGAARLAKGAWFAVSGDPLAAEVVAALSGRVVTVADEERARYHAAATIAANHLVALMGQVEHLAARAGLPLAPFLELAQAALDDVASVGPARALTGPAARGDEATIAKHRGVLDPEDLPAYDALADLARRLAARRDG